MKIKSLRWGYDGGGFACGPVEGNSIVELTAIDEEGKLLFASACSNGEGIDFKVCDMPVFDLLMNLADEDIDFDAMLEKVESHEVENFGALWGDDIPEDMLESQNKDLIAISFAALQHYMNTTEDEEILPEDFIKEFIDEDGMITNVPEISFDDEEDYED